MLNTLPDIKQPKKQDHTITISRFIREKGSLESLPGAAVLVPALGKGVLANTYGFYSITLPADE